MMPTCSAARIFKCGASTCERTAGVDADCRECRYRIMVVGDERYIHPLLMTNFHTLADIAAVDGILKKKKVNPWEKKGWKETQRGHSKGLR
jgi:hypothetical protein